MFFIVTIFFIGCFQWFCGVHSIEWIYDALRIVGLTVYFSVFFIPCSAKLLATDAKMCTIGLDMGIYRKVAMCTNVSWSKTICESPLCLLRCSSRGQPFFARVCRNWQKEWKNCNNAEPLFIACLSPRFACNSVVSCPIIKPAARRWWRGSRLGALALNKCVGEFGPIGGVCTIPQRRLLHSNGNQSQRLYFCIFRFWCLHSVGSGIMVTMSWTPLMSRWQSASTFMANGWGVGANCAHTKEQVHGPKSRHPCLDSCCAWWSCSIQWKKWISKSINGGLSSSCGWSFCTRIFGMRPLGRWEKWTC